MPSRLKTKSTCNLIGKASLGCALSLKLEKTFIQPGNDSIIAEATAHSKNKAQSQGVRTTSKDCYQKNKVIDGTLFIKFIKTLDSPSMGKCPLNIYNLISVTDNKTSACAYQLKQQEKDRGRSHKYIAD